jgi:hypothetical protein
MPVYKTHMHYYRLANFTYKTKQLLMLSGISCVWRCIRGQATCYRDVGYIVDSVSFDLLYGGIDKQYKVVYIIGDIMITSSIALEK